MAEMMKVLVAEDNKELCAQAAAALRGYGYETISAPTPSKNLSYSAVLRNLIMLKRPLYE